MLFSDEGSGFGPSKVPVLQCRSGDTVASNLAVDVRHFGIDVLVVRHQLIGEPRSQLNRVRAWVRRTAHLGRSRV